ncbi:DUF4184 family protein [Paenibacillus nasutitermitis]|uniref:DUF4184 family protein n=1 Tax=Paenibacillus nasutitermitis TaxID=1652958 RepID=A0A916YYH9_9BACL|nr:DUF4184 family protein [Paenibacillus nasutitermitis]GGD67622.1 hypothetical protein GCM10010911_26780 [Paenibacillus nasutitermitis]
MPFTFSHPLYAVPLRKIAPKWLSVTGLVLGSMAPDMEYFIAMEPYRTIGHSLKGFVLLGMPLSIALAFVFHLVVKPVLPMFMPSRGGLDHFVQSLLKDWRLHSVRSWSVFIVSLFIGYLTHIFMDSWTHTSGFVSEFPVLRTYIGGKGIYSWLQYGFSVLGLLVPALVLLRRYSVWLKSVSPQKLRPLASPMTQKLLWGCAFLNAGLLFLVKGWFSVNPGLVGMWIVAPMSAFMFGLFAASLLYIAIRNNRLVGAVTSLTLIGITIMSYKAVRVWLEHRLMADLTLANWKHIQNNQLYIWFCFYLAWALLLLISCLLCARANGAGTKPGDSVKHRVSYPGKY